MQPGSRSLTLRYRVLLAVVSGLLCWLALPGKNQGYLAWLCLAPVLAAIDDEKLSKKSVLLLGWLAGFTLHAGLFTWTLGPLVSVAKLSLPLALLGYASLCLAQSSLFGAWALFTRTLHVRWKMPLVYAAPITMVVMELVYPALVPLHLASSQHVTPMLLQNLDVWGPLGLTFMLTLASAVTYEVVDWLVRHRKPAPLFAGLVLAVMVGGSLAYGVATVSDMEDTIAHADRSVRVGVVQANVGDADPQPDERLRRHREQSLEVLRQGAGLVVWPVSSNSTGLVENVPVLTPGMRRNSLGAANTPVTVSGISYGILLGHEDIKPRYVRDVMRSNPDILVSLSDDAWLGKSKAPAIHHALATLRAVEQRRYLVRATSTGVSAIIDPMGRVVDATPLFARANLVANVAALTGTTLYAMWGDWLAYLMLAVVMVYARHDVRALMRKKKPARVKRAPAPQQPERVS